MLVTMMNCLSLVHVTVLVRDVILAELEFERVVLLPWGFLHSDSFMVRFSRIEPVRQDLAHEVNHPIG